jgi:phospholipase/carboxylesterase
MTNKLLEFIEIETSETIEYSVIWLHGLGASGHDFEPIVPELKFPQRPGVRFIFPHAPIRPITVNGGASMRAWYDIDSLDFDSRQQDDVGIAQSVSEVHDLIDNEIQRGIAENNILLAGFSQGGAIALQAGLTLDKPIAGIVALSTYLPMLQDAVDTIADEKLRTPIFMAHGALDDVIPVSIATASRDMLNARGAVVEWHEYDIPHSVSMEEVEALSTWFKRLFGM